MIMSKICKSCGVNECIKTTCDDCRKKKARENAKMYRSRPHKCSGCDTILTVKSTYCLSCRKRLFEGVDLVLGKWKKLSDTDTNDLIEYIDKIENNKNIGLLDTFMILNYWEMIQPSDFGKYDGYSAPIQIIKMMKDLLEWRKDMKMEKNEFSN